MTDITPIKTALISVSDKTGVADFARALTERGITIISTGGTAKLLSDEGIAITPVADITGMAEMMDGRVKTLHPKIHGGILARRDNKDHIKDMAANAITAIDLVVVNLYPFAETLTRPDATRDDLVENIDIGGPAMIRAAAKNHDFVTTITHADDYGSVLDEIAKHGGTTRDTRRRLAARAFAHTARYDGQIAAWMRDDGHDEALPAEFSLTGSRIEILRYGENAHQIAAGYRLAAKFPRPGALTAEQIQGKQMGYNNINDTDAAFELVAEFDKPTIAIIKHANPCGVASAENISDAWDAALACDPLSAYGGIVAANRKLDGAVAEKITAIFTEVIIAPDADEAAREIIAAKSNLRLLLTGAMPDTDDMTDSIIIKSVAGGFLAQSRDARPITESMLTCVTKIKPTKEQIRDMLFAMKIAKHTKSNAIIYARDEASLGIGAGQMSRVDSSRIAIAKAAERSGDDNSLKDSVVASDAFFPFADGLLAAAEAGASAVIQPGGSRRDDEVIRAVDDAGLTMVFTGQRHFRH